MKRYFVLILVVSMMFFLCRETSCAMGENVNNVKKVSDDRALAKELVQGMVSSYLDYTIPDFADNLSPDFYPSRMEFVNSAGDSFNEKDIVALDFFIDTVNPEGRKLAITFKWQKKVRDKNTGDLDLVKGTAVFVFKNIEGKWKLLSVSGDNPF